MENKVLNAPDEAKELIGKLGAKKFIRTARTFGQIEAELLEYKYKLEEENRRLAERVAFWEQGFKYYIPVLFGLAISTYVLASLYMEHGIERLLQMGVKRKYIYGFFGASLVPQMFSVLDLGRLVYKIKEYRQQINDDNAQDQMGMLGEIFEGDREQLKKEIIKELTKKEKDNEDVAEVILKLFNESDQETISLKQCIQLIKDNGIELSSRKAAECMDNAGFKRLRKKNGLHYQCIVVGNRMGEQGVLEDTPSE